MLRSPAPAQRRGRVWVERGALLLALCAFRSIKCARWPVRPERMLEVPAHRRTARSRTAWPGGCSPHQYCVFSSLSSLQRRRIAVEVHLCLSSQTLDRQEPGPERVAGSRSASRTRSLVGSNAMRAVPRPQPDCVDSPERPGWQVQPLLSRIPVAQFYPSSHVAIRDPSNMLTWYDTCHVACTC